MSRNWSEVKRDNEPSILLPFNLPHNGASVNAKRSRMPNFCSTNLIVSGWMSDARTLRDVNNPAFFWKCALVRGTVTSQRIGAIHSQLSRSFKLS